MTVNWKQEEARLSRPSCETLMLFVNKENSSNVQGKTHFHRLNVSCFERTRERILLSCCHKTFQTIKTDIKV